MKKLALVLLLAAGCAVKPTYLNKEIHTVAVLMPFNDSTYLDAPAKMWGYVEHEVAARGYRLVPRGTLQAFYEQKKFTADPAQINAYSCTELAKEFQCDAVVYSNISYWGYQSLGFYNERGVKLEASLKDGKNGDPLWEGNGKSMEKTGATNWKAAIGGALHTMLADLDPFAGPAAADCFRRMPLAGMEPKE